MGIGKWLTSRFSRQASLPVLATPQLPAPATSALPAAISFDKDKAAIFHNTLLFLIPTEEIQMTAFEDYAPLALYGLQGIPGGGKECVEAVRAFREKFSDLMKSNPEAPPAAAIYDHLAANVGLLHVIRRVLDMPAQDLIALGGPLPVVPGRDLADTIQQHLGDNTRYDRRYHGEWLEDLKQTIIALEEHTGFVPRQKLQLAQTLRLPSP